MRNIRELAIPDRVIARKKAVFMGNNDTQAGFTNAFVRTWLVCGAAYEINQYGGALIWAVTKEAAPNPFNGVGDIWK